VPDLFLAEKVESAECSQTAMTKNAGLGEDRLNELREVAGILKGDDLWR